MKAGILQCFEVTEKAGIVPWFGLIRLQPLPSGFLEARSSPGSGSKEEVRSQAKAFLENFHELGDFGIRSGSLIGAWC
jgi:hypothetical protein